MIQQECRCGKVVVVSDAYAGRKGKCPRCGCIVQMPGGSSSRPDGSATRTPAEAPVLSGSPAAASGQAGSTPPPLPLAPAPDATSAPQPPRAPFEEPVALLPVPPRAEPASAPQAAPRSDPPARAEHVPEPPTGQVSEPSAPSSPPPGSGGTEMIRYPCGRCGAVLESSSSLAGQEDICPDCGQPCRVPLEATSTRRWLVPVLIVAGVVAILLAGGAAYWWRGSQQKIVARRSKAIVLAGGQKIFQASSPKDCALLLDVSNTISPEELRRIPRGGTRLTFSGGLRSPAVTITGPPTSSEGDSEEETEVFVKMLFAVPQDVRTFTLHLGDRPPVEFTAPEAIAERIEIDD